MALAAIRGRTAVLVSATMMMANVTR